jgi:hypothetical protein
MYARDFPEVAGAIQAQSPEAMGMSYELADARVEDMRAEVWKLTRVTFTGAAILLREKAASQINYNLFDIELGDQQKQFAYLQAKDLVDTVSGVMVAHDVALWNGNDTSLSTPTTTQYMGVIPQIVAGGTMRTIRCWWTDRKRSQRVSEGAPNSGAPLLARWQVS